MIIIVTSLIVAFSLLKMALHDISESIVLYGNHYGINPQKFYFQYWKFRFNAASLIEIDFDYTTQVDDSGIPKYENFHDETAKVTWGLIGPWRHSNLVLK